MDAADQPLVMSGGLFFQMCKGMQGCGNIMLLVELLLLLPMWQPSSAIQLLQFYMGVDGGTNVSGEDLELAGFLAALLS